MNRYQVFVIVRGVHTTTRTVEAMNALSAINLVEANFEPTKLSLSVGKGEFITVEWTGVEFEAKRVK